MVHTQGCWPQQVCAAGQGAWGCAYNPTDSPTDFTIHMTKPAPPLPQELVQRHRAWRRPQSPSEELGKYSGTESMLNPHLSQLSCFEGPI